MQQPLRQAPAVLDHSTGRHTAQHTSLHTCAFTCDTLGQVPTVQTRRSKSAAGPPRARRGHQPRQTHLDERGGGRGSGKGAPHLGAGNHGRSSQTAQSDTQHGSLKRRWRRRAREAGREARARPLAQNVRAVRGLRDARRRAVHPAPRTRSLGYHVGCRTERFHRHPGAGQGLLRLCQQGAAQVRWQLVSVRAQRRGCLRARTRRAACARNVFTRFLLCPPSFLCCAAMP